MTIAEAEAYRKAGHFSEALAIYRSVLEHEPKNTSAYRGMANLSLDLRRPESAAAMILQALSLDLDNVDSQKLLLRVLEAQQTPQAVGRLLFDHSLDLKASGRMELALRCHRKALTFDSALSATDDYAAARMLAAGDLKNGWMAYEWRNTIAAPGPFADRIWNGEDLSGKTVLVWGEQGIGDHMMYANCLPDLIEIASLVLVETDARLVTMFARTFPTAVVHGGSKYKGNKPITNQDLSWLKKPPDPDYFVFMGSLPRIFRPTIDRFPATSVRFKADLRRTEKWRDRLNDCGHGLKIGVNWRSLLRSTDRQKLYPSLDSWEPIFLIPGIQLVNLQVGSTEQEKNRINEICGGNLSTFGELDLLDDLDGTASLIAALDGVVTSESYIRCLGPLLGIPTWAVINTRGHQRWSMLGQTHFPWFPELNVYLSNSDADLTAIFETMAKQVKRLEH